jgi:8-oxo-dGTP pyrophosphatase MutT (NUDIX family)
VAVLICRTSSNQRWVLPKGLIDPGESIPQTALREVREEAGVNVRIVSRLDPPEHYTFMRGDLRVTKTVHYFLMEYVSGNEADHDHEMDSVMWTTIDHALEMLAYESARSVMSRAKTMLDQDKLSKN